MYYCIVEKITTTPRKINCFGTYTHMCTVTWLVKSRVESKKTGNCKLADGGRDHDPRREAAYGNSNIPSK
ncbi:hypothetical protein DTK66_07130 [Lactobacillus sp. M31]|uniref:Uncharacterized protein n=1 Tax=Limosilactobacillus walteri TaxID=2268022 RepID=A0ABR8P836_9LACO|nr:hypothetical protein [Limosilactobacillus walteri]